MFGKHLFLFPILVYNTHTQSWVCVGPIWVECHLLVGREHVISCPTQGCEKLGGGRDLWHDFAVSWLVCPPLNGLLIHLDTTKQHARFTIIKYEGNSLRVLTWVILKALTGTNTFKNKQLTERTFKNGLWLCPHDRVGGFVWERVHVRVREECLQI